MLYVSRILDHYYRVYVIFELNYFKEIIFALRMTNCALRHTFTPKKALQNYGTECKAASHQALNIYEIDL